MGKLTIGNYFISKVRKYGKHLIACLKDGAKNIKKFRGTSVGFDDLNDNREGIRTNINIIFNNLIDLINDGEYKRFNVSDFYNKSTKIHFIIDAIMDIKNKIEYTKSKTNILSMDETNIFLSLVHIRMAFPYLFESIKTISKIIDSDKVRSREEIFIEIRNLIAKEWKQRNILNNPNLKDLNYLKYSVDEYHEYLHNCLNMLMRDTKRFISRYPLEYKNNPDIDVELMIALRNSIFNNIPTSDEPIDFYYLATIANNKNNDLVEKMQKPILRGWFKDEPKSNYISVLRYREYKRNSQK